MPLKNEHLARSQQNLQFARSFDLATTPYLDWVVTAYFYAALHLVDALLDQQDQIHPPDHKVRWEMVKGRYYLMGIKTEYRDLKEHSENARCQLLTFTKPKIERDVIPLYEEIERHIKQQLK